jgi:hypothetical protein
LKTLEKINRKGIRNSLEIEKAISAHLAQADPIPSAPAPACPRCRTCGPRLSAPTCALTPSLPLAAMWGQSIGAVPFPRARPLSLYRRAHLSIIPNLLPTIPRRGCAHDHTFSGHVLTSASLLSPAPCSSTSPRSLAPSAKPPRPLSRSACVTRELP